MITETIENISKNRTKYSVQAKDLKTNEVLLFSSVNKAQEYFGFGLSSIYQCCLKRRKSVNNIVFTYIKLIHNENK